MARLRLFAGLRDLAGTDRAEIEGGTVAEVLTAAVDRFGSGFAGAAENARVWVNGEEADPSDRVQPDDEVALIPPVSGGSTAMDTVPVAGGTDFLASLGAVAVLAFANLATDSVWWPVAVVGVVTAWVADVVETLTRRGREFPLIPTLLAILLTVAATWSLGPVGLGVAAVASVVLPLGWGVASDGSRMVQILGPSVLLTFVASTAVASLVGAASAVPEVGPAARVIGVYVAVAAVSVLAGTAVERFQHLPFADPFTAAALVAIVTALVAASIWSLDLITFMIVGLVVAVALVAGRGLGSILRTRQVILIERPPGMLSLLDGLVLAATLYLPVLQIAG